MPIARTVVVFVMLFVFLVQGCHPAAKNITTDKAAEQGTKTAGDTAEYQISHSGFEPVKSEILPVTRFIRSLQNQPGSYIQCYVSLLDVYETQIKAPAVFRFELYRYIKHASNHKGGRVKLWRDFNLTESQANNKYWHNFFRAYKFSLPFEPEPGRNYLLQVSCLYGNKKRLSAYFVIKPSGR